MSPERRLHTQEPTQTPATVDLDLLRKRDVDSWEKLYRSVHHRLVGYGNRLRPGSGEDFAQTTWTNFLVGLSENNIRSDRNIEGYLLTGVRYRSVDSFRRFRNKFEIPTDIDNELASHSVARHPEDETVLDPEVTNEIFETYGITKMVDKQIAVLTAMGFSSKEIGTMLGKSDVAVRTQRSRLVKLASKNRAAKDRE
jgi:DNA-directed RNA polymerase specialized sigma24 family protein